MFSKKWATVVLIAGLNLLPLPVSALTADIYGYTKAEDVTGSMRVSDDAVTLELMGFRTVYFHPLEIYISQGYDLVDRTMIGVLPPGFEGTTTFVLENREVSEQDMVLFMVPGWTVPVAVGLFRDEAAIYYKPPELEIR